MATIHDLAAAIDRHAPKDGIHPTALPDLLLLRSSAPSMPLHTIYRPTLCIVAQGRKRAMIGPTPLVYDPATFLVVAIDLPVIGAVIEASPEKPYLCLRLDLDLVALGELALGHPVPVPAAGETSPGLALSPATPGLIDAATRLVELLDAPDDVAVLAPLVVREILWRLMTGEQSAMIRRIASAESRLAQVGRAIGWLKNHFAERFGIEAVAEVAGMSPSAFYEHFKAATAMTPLQYRNQLRLQEARRLMVLESLDAADAGYQVGYDSPSQFSRDYVRLFGNPPARDAALLRESPDYRMVA
jgi:AraC-like DNA-binding protein